MLKELRQHWKQFKTSPPGQRFRRIHESRAKRRGGGTDWRRWVWLILGILLTLAGLFFLAAPGPGMVVLAAGLALIAGESLSVARLLDWAELKLRPLYLWAKRRWKSMEPRIRWLIIGAAGAVGLAMLAAGYFFLMR